MKTKINIILTITVIAGLLIAACEGPEGPAGPQGPQGDQGDQGTEGPIGEQGEQGNANVTLYIFPGHDFQDESQWFHCFQSLEKEEWEYSHWSAFFIIENQLPEGGAIMIKFSLENFPDYTFATAWNIVDPTISCANKALAIITEQVMGNQSGDEVDGIHLIRIEAENIEDCSEGNCKQLADPVIPPGLDMADYDAIIEYFGLNEDNIVRM